MKPSLYFADSLRYFFKRFYSDESLTQWFSVRAGGESNSFQYPLYFKPTDKVVVFLPNDAENTLKILNAFSPFWKKDCVFAIAQESLSETLLHQNFPVTLLWTRSHDFRYGEQEFLKLTNQIETFAPKICFFFADAFLPALYLARRSQAPYRFYYSKGGTSEPTESVLYPFLNIAIRASSFNEALSTLIRQYNAHGEKNG